MVQFLFSVHTSTEAQQSNSQGGSQGGGSSRQVIWPGTLWCSAATVCDKRKIVIFTNIHVSVELIGSHVNVLTKQLCDDADKQYHFVHVRICYRH